MMEKLELMRLQDQLRREATDLDHRSWHEGDKTHTRPWRVRICLWTWKKSLETSGEAQMWGTMNLFACSYLYFLSLLFWLVTWKLDNDSKIQLIDMNYKKWWWCDNHWGYLSTSSTLTVEYILFITHTLLKQRAARHCSAFTFTNCRTWILPQLLLWIILVEMTVMPSEH